MRISKLGDLILEVGLAVRVLNRWSLTEVEPDLSSKQAEEIRSMKSELYQKTVVKIAEFLKSEGYIVFPAEQFPPYGRSVPVPVHE